MSCHVGAELGSLLMMFSSISAVCMIKTIANKSSGVGATNTLPQLQKELRPLLEQRFAPRANYHCQDPNNQNFDTISTLFLKMNPFCRESNV
jgi:hypothetical protein